MPLPSFFLPRSRRAWPFATALTVLAGLVGLACQPSIGDRCNLSTDCSQRGDRLCDRSQLGLGGGYCTIFNCTGNGCPDEAACVVTGSSVPGCGFGERGVARSARSFCLKTCEVDGDCRNAEGYRCKGLVRPGAPTGDTDIEGVVLDDEQSKRVCVFVGLPEGGVIPPISSQPDAAVCQAAGPEVDAAAYDPVRDASADARSDASADAATDASDAGAGDGGSQDAASDGG